MVEVLMIPKVVRSCQTKYAGKLVNLLPEISFETCSQFHSFFLGMPRLENGGSNSIFF